MELRACFLIWLSACTCGAAYVGEPLPAYHCSIHVQLLSRTPYKKNHGSKRYLRLASCRAKSVESSFPANKEYRRLSFPYYTYYSPVRCNV